LLENIMTNADHETFLRRAIALSAKAALEYSTGGVFGAVVVKDGKIVSEGMNRVVASHDPTWHGEMEAMRLACITLQSFKLTGCTLYSAGELCPMCLATAYWAGIENIYYAATVADAFEYGNFDDGFIYKELALPPDKRRITSRQMLRAEAVEVWKKYKAKPDKVAY
jgi:guanine deaminase